MKRREPLMFTCILGKDIRHNLNAMHILFSFLQKAEPKEKPIIATVLLQLDLLGDPTKCSVFRDEAIDVIMEGLDCYTCNEKVQEQVARSLLILGGRFSYKGDVTSERLILAESGFDGKCVDMMHLSIEEDEEIQNWQTNTAKALLTRGNKKLLSALCECISNAIPCLARASLVTISRTSCYLDKVADQNYQSEACSILVPCLVQLLDDDRVVEERVLASFALLSLAKCTGFWYQISPMVERLSRHLVNLSQDTWTARELDSIIREISTNGSIS